MYNIHKTHIEVWGMNRIRELRQTNGWTQDELATRLNTKRTTISNYEVGIRGLDVDTILRLCDIFGCTADYLLGRSIQQRSAITDEDAALLAAYHEAPLEIQKIVNAALEAYIPDEAVSDKETA